MSKGCGCQSGILRFVKPPYAKKFYVPCCMHDDDYERGGGKAERLMSDRDLFLRMMRIVNKNEISPWRVTWFTLVPLLYYVSVRVFGWRFFNFKN